MFLILLYILVLIICTILATIYCYVIRPQKRIYDIFRSQGIKGEPFVPFFGQIFALRRYRGADMLMSYHSDLVKKHGNVLLFGFGPVVRLLVNEPDMLADIFSRHNAQNYRKPPITTAVFGPIFGIHNLLVAEGKEHDRARRMLNPAFHHTNLKSMISIITDRTEKNIDSILTSLSSNQESSQPIDLQILFNTLTLSIIVSSAFGADFETNSYAKHVTHRILNEVLDAVIYRSLIMVNQVPFLSKVPSFRKGIIDKGSRTIREFVDQIIIDRRQKRSSSICNGPDLLDLLLWATDDEGQPFTNEEIKDQALTFVVAGSETTANLMVWMFYILMTHEGVLRVCREEIDRVLPDGIVPTNEHLSELVICEAVIKETLRLYPSAPLFVRHCIKEHYIGTKDSLCIPAEATVLINSYILHRRSDLWPRPLEFDYTRWLRDPKTGVIPKLAHPFAYLPFAAGPRNCIGQNFALLEAKIILAMFIQRCDFSLIPGQKIVPDVKITLKAKYGLLANIRKRQM